MDKIVKEDRSEENLNNIRTIQVNSPHEHNHILQTYTPQPSTPIKHAGSKHNRNRNTNTYLSNCTTRHSHPIKHAGSKHKTGFPTQPEPPTIKHITPQPSTPIKHAGSNY